MKIAIDPLYDPVTEKPYCCVAAVLQMIHQRRGLDTLTQDEIGYQLGLIVPEELEHHFDRVRTGAEPTAGYGTQTSRAEFSLSAFLQRMGDRLRMSFTKPKSCEDLAEQFSVHLRNGDDVVICYSSQMLFGDGDPEHVSLIQQFDPSTEEVVVIDPAIGAPKLRVATLSALFDVLTAHRLSDLGGLWIFASTQKTAT